jgi:hypothetical protein
MSQDKALKDILLRLEKLEQIVFGAQPANTQRSNKVAKEEFKGATGGLRLLTTKGFFNQRRFFSEIETELRKQGYHYSKQAIQTPLNRLSSSNGPLVGLKEKGKKVYAKRK